MQLDPAPAVVPPPLLAAADLQDNLLMVDNDLDRLQTLLGDACDTMLKGFLAATRTLQAPAGEAPAAAAQAIEHLGSAVIALQFQDMASQLLTHTRQRVRHCTDRLAQEVFQDDGADGETVVEALPLRPNPVTQDEMDAGSIDLF